MNRKYWKITAILMMLSVLILSMTGCKEKDRSAEGDPYTVYYLNSQGNQLTGNEYRTHTTDPDDLTKELLDQMGTVPPHLDCQSAIPDKVEKITLRREDNVLYLNADANYALMNSVREILCRAALTRTLTQAEGVDYLSISCADQPIVDAAGNPVGMLSDSDFVDNIRDVNSFEKVEMTIYFANEAGDRLVPERREVMRSTNTSLERLIVEQLIEGPAFSNHYPVIPDDVKLLSVSVNDSLCAINFDAGFLNNLLDVQDYIPIYAIVNSLSELSTVSRVQIRINGSQDAVFRESIPLNTVFERKYEYMEGGNEN